MTNDASSPGSSSAPTLTARDVLASPSVLAFLVSQFVVTTGVMLQAAALGKHVYDITGDEINIGWLGLAEFLPAAVLVLVTGTVADRFNRKYVGIVALLGEAMSALALLLYARTNPTSAAPMFIIAVVFGASRAFAAPSIRSIVPMIAPEVGFLGSSRCTARRGPVQRSSAPQSVGFSIPSTRASRTAVQRY